MDYWCWFRGSQKASTKSPQLPESLNSFYCFALQLVLDIVPHRLAGWNKRRWGFAVSFAFQFAHWSLFCFARSQSRKCLFFASARTRFTIFVTLSTTKPFRCLLCCLHRCTVNRHEKAEPLVKATKQTKASCTTEIEKISACATSTKSLSFLLPKPSQ